jgi:hypothetical protein
MYASLTISCGGYCDETQLDAGLPSLLISEDLEVKYEFVCIDVRRHECLSIRRDYVTGTVVTRVTKSDS